MGWKRGDDGAQCQSVISLWNRFDNPALLVYSGLIKVDTLLKVDSERAEHVSLLDSIKPQSWL